MGRSVQLSPCWVSEEFPPDRRDGQTGPCSRQQEPGDTWEIKKGYVNFII